MVDVTVENADLEWLEKYGRSVSGSRIGAMSDLEEMARKPQMTKLKGGAHGYWKTRKRLA